MLVKDLSIGQMQMVEIVKALAQEAKIVIMDEPTSSLSQSEVQKLFAIITELKKKLITIVYISHRIQEIIEITDRIICLRDGKNVGTLVTKDANFQKLIHMMVGRDIAELYPKRNIPKKEILFKVSDIRIPQYKSSLSFSLCQGEILGFAGLIGSGRSEFMKAIFGIEKSFEIVGP